VLSTFQKRLIYFMVALTLSAALIIGGGSLPSQADVTVSAPNGMTFPADSDIYNVRNYGAKGDGTTDDSNAIQRAFDAASGQTSILFFPRGTYLVSKPLTFYRWIMIQGESQTGTVIKLKDNAPGYQDPNKPNWVVVASLSLSLTGGGDNTAHSQYFCNMTVDVGNNNPGAGALLYMSNNGGGLRDVTLRSGNNSGLVGLDLRKSWDGPALYKGVTVEGFNIGVWLTNGTYSSDFEHLTLRGQRQVGIRDEGHPLTVRKLYSENRVTSLESTQPNGLVVLFDSTIKGTSSTGTAIVNQGAMYVTRVRVSGYQFALSGNGRTINPGRVEYTSQNFGSNFPSRQPSFAIAFKETPILPWKPLSEWVNVKTYENLVENGDWAPAIQAAIDSGKPVIYLPNGIYRVGRTIYLRGNGQILEGLSSTLVANKGQLGSTPMIQVNNGVGTNVFIDRLIVGPEDPSEQVVLIKHASSRNLVILNSRGLTYRNSPGVGNLYVDDMVGGQIQFDYPQNAYFHQLNIEGSYTKLINKAARVWIQGFKSEETGTLVNNTSPSASTVILGGLDYPANDSLSRSATPSNVNNGGTFMAVQKLAFANNTVVRETVGGVTKNYQLPVSDTFLFFKSITPN
jgi:hypothetical protein